MPDSGSEPDDPGSDDSPRSGHGSSEADNDGTISWGGLADESTARLAAAGIDGARRQALLIVMKACGADSTEWFSTSSDPATVRGVAAIDTMVGRRSAGEPLQYVLGEWSFRHLDLFIDRRVLIPRPETEVVAGRALAELHRLAPGKTPIVAADMGTGSGAIGLSLVTEHPAVQMWLTDVSGEALAVARANLAGIGYPGQRVRVGQGSWFEALPDDLSGQFGLIVSNPPYVPADLELSTEVAEWEPDMALVSGPTGTEYLEHLIVESPNWLTSDGSLVLELSPEQAEPMSRLAAGTFAQVAIARDLSGRDRALIARMAPIAD